MSDFQKFIDVDNVFKSKNPKLYKWIPRLIIKIVKRIVHQDELNKILEKHSDKYGIDFASAVLDDFGVKTNIIGKENLPKGGRQIIAANHPLGGLDGLVLISEIGKQRKDIKFIVNDILLNISNLKNVFIPVNKHGSNAKEAIRLIDAVYSSEDLVITFPSGLVSRKHKDGIYDLEWQKSFIKKSRIHQRDIIPVYIEGLNSNFFYNLSRFRKKIGIKTNIEMFLLVDEVFKQKDKNILINIGKPIPFNIFDSSKNDIEWAQYVKGKVYSMKQSTSKQ